MASAACGETDLAALLRGLSPELDAEIYTFALVTEAELAALSLPLGTFQAGLRHEGAFRRITLTVHSSLAAVGLTARASTALASRGIACNMVAGFHHDHIFVPTDRATDALEILNALEE
ncbi:hypothetical protein M885DRAFT_614467 [Pelagophyceae sp. CCMP2097]|nr:hypothetical protein M885DRAFT_614467 [Pelagophyceae sp. CCMP2097]